MSDYTGPNHRVTVTTYPYAKTILPSGEREEGVEVDHDVRHPAECDRLPYGQMCALDVWLSESGAQDAGMPMQAGVYLVCYWGTGPDHNGEYDCALTVAEAPAEAGDDSDSAPQQPSGFAVPADTEGAWT
jgi:hypothetical protein